MQDEKNEFPKKVTGPLHDYATDIGDQEPLSDVRKTTEHQKVVTALVNRLAAGEEPTKASLVRLVGAIKDSEVREKMNRALRLRELDSHISALTQAALSQLAREAREKKLELVDQEMKGQIDKALQALEAYVKAEQRGLNIDDSGKGSH